MFPLWLSFIAVLSGILSAFFRYLFWAMGWVEGDANRAKRPLISLYTALTAGVFMFFIGKSWDPHLLIPLCLYVSLLVSFSVIDVEEKVIPTYAWIFGFFCAVGVSWFFPSIVGGGGAFEGVVFSLTGAVGGAGIIFLMVELGKLLFGKIEVVPDTPQRYFLEQVEDDWFFCSEGERMALSEVIMRKNDYILIEHEDGSNVKIAEKTVDTGTGFRAIDQVHGVAKKITIPREAMGFGDVKFMIMGGAMIGLQGSAFAIFAGAVIGSLVGIALKFSKGNREIPFVPFLSAGIILYLLAPNYVSFLFEVILGERGLL